MLKFQGGKDPAWGGESKINIRIYGDGVSKEIYIDVSKPPFDLAFQGFFPKNVLAANIKNGVVKTVSLQNNTLYVLFGAAPAAADLTKPDPPFTSFEVQFVYGSDIT